MLGVTDGATLGRRVGQPSLYVGSKLGADIGTFEGVIVGTGVGRPAT